MKEILIILVVFFIFLPHLKVRYKNLRYNVKELLLMKLGFLFFSTALAVTLGEEGWKK